MLSRASQLMLSHRRYALVSRSAGSVRITRSRRETRWVSPESAQYTSNDYLDHCQRHQLRPFVGRVATCFDNAVAESFWASLKRECLQGRVFATRAEARRKIFTWINWYNSSRLHSSLDYTPPTRWEQQHQQAS